MHVGHQYVILARLGLLPILQCLGFFFDVRLYRLYILEIKPLCIASFVNIFSHSVVFLFLMVSFVVQKFVSLKRSHWFIYLFFLSLLPWETDLRKHLYS